MNTKDRLFCLYKTSTELGKVRMTKEEVYVSKGCPAYIAWGKKTEKNSLNEIMKSDNRNKHINAIKINIEPNKIISF